MQAFGNVALVFAILERVLPASEFKFDEEKKTWNPADLRQAEEPATVKLWEPIAAIVFTAAALIIFNGYPDVIGTSLSRTAGDLDLGADRCVLFAGCRT